MAIDVQRKKIGDHTYRVEQLRAKAARNVLLRLFKILGPAASEVVQNPEAIAKAIQLFTESTTEADLDYLCDTFAATTKVVLTVQLATGPTEREADLGPIFEDHFSGRLQDMFGWLLFCLEVNFSSFFGGQPGGSLAGLLVKLGKETPKASAPAVPRE